MICPTCRTAYFIATTDWRMTVKIDYSDYKYMGCGCGNVPNTEAKEPPPCE